MVRLFSGVAEYWVRGKWWTVPLFLLLALCALFLVAQTGSALGSAPEDPPATFLIRLYGCGAPTPFGGCDTPAERIERLARDYGFRVRRQIPQIGVWEIESTNRLQRGLPTALQQDGDVLWVEPNGLVHASEINPSDTFYQAQQAHLHLIGLPVAWEFATGDARPLAIIDSGIDLDHPDLAAKVWTNPGEIPDNNKDDDNNGYKDDASGWDFVNDDAIPQDDFSHGSHVAGIAAAQTDNDTGIAGVSWASPIMALKALDRHGNGTWADIAGAIIYAADNGAHILNLSLGGAEPSQTIQAAVSYAQKKGCLLVAAAGNNDSQPTAVEYPAALPGVMAVAATTDGDEPAFFSNRGPEVDVAAPGVNILSANSSGSYYFNSGTSMSASHVSGLAALIWSLQPSWSAGQVAQAIRSTARDVYLPGKDQRTGWGRIDAQASILNVVGVDVTLEADRPFVVAGDEQATVTATITLDQGQPVPDGVRVAFQTTLGSVKPLSATTFGGQATASFSSSQLGQATITASTGPDDRATSTITVLPHPVQLSLAADRQFLVAESEAAILTATATYSLGQAVGDGLPVTFHTTLGSVNPATPTTQGGQVTATLTSLTSGPAIVTASLGPRVRETVTITVLPPPLQVTLTADRLSILAGREQAILTATVTYSQGQAIPNGFPVTFQTTLGAVLPPLVTAQGGQAATILASSQCGQATVTARALGGAADSMVISILCRLYVPIVQR